MTVFFVIFYLLLSAGLYLVFQKAGVAGWKGLVPGYNFVVWCQIVGRQPWYAVLLLIPIVNIFIFVNLSVNMVRSFSKYSFGHSALAVIAAPLIFIYLGLSKDESYDGPNHTKEQAYRKQIQEARKANNDRLLRKLERQNPYHKSSIREWAEAIVFAVFAAAFIRMFLIEAYVIPTPSMEGSLLVGDFLFVSKAHYGIRTPQTIAMVPLLHNRIPVLNRESYLKKPQLPYRRLPALEQINRNDPVVFNYPEGDSVYIFPARTWSIHDKRQGRIPPVYERQIESGRVDLVTRPVDKMDHYIKRCVGAPGDELEIRDRQVFINGKPGEKPENVQFIYSVTSPNGQINSRNFADWGISSDDLMARGTSNEIYMVLSDGQREKVQGLDPQIDISPVHPEDLFGKPALFPNDPAYADWTLDNYGPVKVPARGETIQLNTTNLPLYERVIDVYEGQDLKLRDGKIFINGTEISEYTFEQDYYWMMGDNRHNSEDSRYWGFVPHDHIVGKPLFIWFSTREGSMAKGIRWNRIFKSASDI